MAPHRFLLLCLLSAALVLPVAAQPPTASISTCNNRYRGKSCLNCTEEDMQEAIKKCLPAHTYHVENNTLVSTMAPETDWGFGNHLAQYYQARGVAKLAGMEFVARPPFQYRDIRLVDRQPAAPPEAQYYRVNELKHYCDACPSDSGTMQQRWFHTCTAAWAAVGVGDDLRAAVLAASPTFPKRDVVIQFRCSDSHAHAMYGMLPFSYYEVALSPHIKKGARVAILPDPGVAKMPFCMDLLKALELGLFFTFRADVEILQSRNLSVDLATMMHARVLVGSDSTLGLFAALGCTGTAYLPIDHIMVGRQKPCFPNIRWVDTRLVRCAPNWQLLPEVVGNMSTWFTDNLNLRVAIGVAIRRPR